MHNVELQIKCSIYVSLTTKLCLNGTVVEHTPISRTVDFGSRCILFECLREKAVNQIIIIYLSWFKCC